MDIYLDINTDIDIITCKGYHYECYGIFSSNMFSLYFLNFCFHNILICNLIFRFF